MLKISVKFKVGFGCRVQCLGGQWGHFSSVAGTAGAGAADPVRLCPCAPSAAFVRAANPPELLFPLIPGQGRRRASEGGQCHGAPTWLREVNKHSDTY